MFSGSHSIRLRFVPSEALFRAKPEAPHLESVNPPGPTLGLSGGAFLRKSKIDPKSAFSAGGDSGATATRVAHMRLVSTKQRPWGLIYGLGATLGGSGVL